MDQGKNVYVQLFKVYGTRYHLKKTALNQNKIGIMKDIFFLKILASQWNSKPTNQKIPHQNAAKDISYRKLVY